MKYLFYLFLFIISSYSSNEFKICEEIQNNKLIIKCFTKNDFENENENNFHKCSQNHFVYDEKQKQLIEEKYKKSISEDQ